MLFRSPGDDIWRYVWEGYIQLQGFNPYDFAPNAAELIPYRFEWWEQINNDSISAIYPPLTKLGFRSLAAIAPHFLLFKLAFVAADIFTCYLLTRKFTYWQTTFYAWNPLIIYSFAGGGHYDSWFILPLVAAWLCCDLDADKLANWFVGAFLVGISIAIKWISLPILGFLSWQAWHKISFKTAIIVSICGLLPFLVSAIVFCNADSCYLIPTDSNFVSHGRSAEFIPYWLGKVWPVSRKTNSIFALPLGLAVLFLLAKARNFQQFTKHYFFALLTISPIIHGWYFTWIVPFAVARKNLGVGLVSISSLAYFILPYRQSLGHKNWRLTIIETLLLWLPFILGYFSNFTINLSAKDEKLRAKS